MGRQAAVAPQAMYVMPAVSTVLADKNAFACSPSQAQHAESTSPFTHSRGMWRAGCAGAGARARARWTTSLVAGPDEGVVEVRVEPAELGVHVWVVDLDHADCAAPPPDLTHRVGHVHVVLKQPRPVCQHCKIRHHFLTREHRDRFPRHSVPCSSKQQAASSGKRAGGRVGAGLHTGAGGRQRVFVPIRPDLYTALCRCGQVLPNVGRELPMPHTVYE